MRKPARPAPPPQTRTAVRLEEVRARVGIPSLRAFWTRLVEGQGVGAGWDDPVSYEAVRNYHHNREPTPSYLARVAEVFGFRLEWLVADWGEPTEAEGEFMGQEDPAHPKQLSVGATPGQPRWPFDYHEVARFALIIAWRELAAAEGGPSGKVVEEGVGAWTLTRSGQIFAQLQNAVMEPIRILGLPEPDPKDEAFNDYAVAVAQAIRHYARAHRGRRTDISDTDTPGEKQ